MHRNTRFQPIYKVLITIETNKLKEKSLNYLKLNLFLLSHSLGSLLSFSLDSLFFLLSSSSSSSSSSFLFFFSYDIYIHTHTETYKQRLKNDGCLLTHLFFLFKLHFFPFIICTITH